MNNILDTHVSTYEGRNDYDFDNGIILNWYPKRIIELAKNAHSILELGLGHGITANIFLKHFTRYVILEGSSAVIDNFKNRFPDCHANIVQTFFEQFTTDNKFDVIVMGFVLEHVDNPRDILLRYKSFLAPNGKMFITVPNAEALNRRLGHYSGMLPDMGTLSENDITSGHKRYFTVQSLTDMVRSAGFEVERMEGLYLKPFTTKQILSLHLETSVLQALCKIGMSYPELSLGIFAMIKEC